jgi:hypothetical protein
MDGTIINFGDIFRYRETEYVFLAQTEDTVFAAKIIDGYMAGKIQHLSDNREAIGSRQKRNPLYSFVILSTKDFEGQAAHFANTGGAEHQSVKRFDIINALNKKDLIEIKAEIESENSVVPIRLIELVKQLNIT